MKISNEELLEKYCRLWNATYWEIQRHQIMHPEQEELLREEVFELEIMERRMMGLIPASHDQAIKELCANI